MTELVDLIDSSSEGNEQECEFIIEDLINVRKMDNEIQFEVRWEGYKELTWEPLASLEHIGGPLRTKLNALMARLKPAPIQKKSVQKVAHHKVQDVATAPSRRDSKAADMSLIEFAKNKVESKKLINATAEESASAMKRIPESGQQSEQIRKRAKTSTTTKISNEKYDWSPSISEIKKVNVVESPERQMIPNHKNYSDTVNGFELYKKLRLGIWKVTGFIQNQSTKNEPLLKVQRDSDTCWVSIWDVKRINNEGCGVSEQILLNYISMIAHSADGIEFDDPSFK